MYKEPARRYGHSWNFNQLDEEQWKYLINLSEELGITFNRKQFIQTAILNAIECLEILKQHREAKQ